MRSLYLDCGMGAAGDMLSAALLELHPDREGFLRRMNSLALPGVEISAEKCVKCGISGTHFKVLVSGVQENEDIHEHHHHHTGLHSISRIIDGLALPEKVREDIRAVYSLLAESESRVHGVDMEHIHFHEVGSMDAVADITAFCLLVSELAVDRITVSPVCVGSGTVRCAHGILPVPAPATAELLRGIPMYPGDISAELCTPTGAALLRHFADGFGAMPMMCLEAIGYGMGKKDFPRANCVRAMLGETEESGDSIAELSCNVDDMTAEDIGYALERIMECGALDVFTIPIGMKKSRPAICITVLCAPERKEEFARLLFLYTSTLGVRESVCSRYVLERSVDRMETPLGPVRMKKSAGYGVSRCKYEYEDIARLAGEQGSSPARIREILDSLRKDIPECPTKI